MAAGLNCTTNTHAQASRPASIQFTNVTGPSGIKFVHYRGNDGIPINREIFGPGVCVADFDGDGLPDIYFVNGRDLYNRGISARNALYRNNGDGTFADVTEAAGVPGTGYGFGCVWGDYDNDVFPDLYVGGYVDLGPGSPRYCNISGARTSCPPSAYKGTPDILYHNNGDGTFTNVTKAAGSLHHRFPEKLRSSLAQRWKGLL